MEVDRELDVYKGRVIIKSQHPQLGTSHYMVVVTREVLREEEEVVGD